MLYLQMLKITLSLVAGVLLLGVVSCVQCPDGKECPGKDTCCRHTDGYSCCPYPDVGGLGGFGDVGVKNVPKPAFCPCPGGVLLRHAPLLPFKVHL